MSHTLRANGTSRDDARPTLALRELLLALALASVGALGALPGSRGGADPVALLAWLSLCALPSGVLLGASSAALWPIGPVLPALWMGGVGLVAAFSPRVLPTPAWSACAWTGLFAMGFALGRLAPARRWPIAAASLALCGALDALSISGAWLAAPLPAAVSARLLDLAPATLLAECAGLDWMRHPAIYEPAGALDIDPALRVAWRGFLAGPIVFLLGCGVALAAERIARRKRRSSDLRGGHS